MIFTRFTVSGKTPWRGIYLLNKIVLELSRILPLALIMLVEILSQPTLLLFLSLYMTLVISRVAVDVKFSNS